MKFFNHRGEDVEVRWSDHAPACPRCRDVDLDGPASYAWTCVQGAQLLTEELKKRQASVERARAKKNLEWAEEAGTFINKKAKDKDHLARITRYVEKQS
jgi:hypothetical protein